MAPTFRDDGSPGWASMYMVAGIAALLTLLVVLLDIAATFVPGGGVSSEHVDAAERFAELESHPLLGLRNLGLLNVITMLLGAPVMLVLYHAHRRTHQAYAALAAFLFLMGAAVYIAKNPALSMLDLSRQYTAAGSDADTSRLTAAGSALLAHGEDFTPGAFVGFLLPSASGIVMSIVLLRGRIFSKATGWAGLLSSSLLLIFVIAATFAPAALPLVTIAAAAGGLLLLAYHLLLARRLFQLAGRHAA